MVEECCFVPVVELEYSTRIRDQNGRGSCFVPVLELEYSTRVRGQNGRGMLFCISARVRVQCRG